MINDEQYDILNKDIYNKSFEQLYHYMDHVHGSGIWSTIVSKIMETATKGVAGVTGQQVANKAGYAVLDGTSSALRKRTETLIDEALNKKKKVKSNTIIQMIFLLEESKKTLGLEPKDSNLYKHVNKLKKL